VIKADITNQRINTEA